MLETIVHSNKHSDDIPWRISQSLMISLTRCWPATSVNHHMVHELPMSYLRRNLMDLQDPASTIGNSTTCQWNTFTHYPYLTLALTHWVTHTFFSTLDLREGYWKVGNDPETTDKTYHHSRKFKVLLSGLPCAPAVFQRPTNLVTRGLTWEACLCVFRWHFGDDENVRKTLRTNSSSIQ